MRHWLQLGTRSWRARPARSALAVLAIALGVGVVVWVTCCYESVRVSVTRAVLDWIGRSHIIIEPRAGVWGFFDADIEEEVARIPGVSRTTTRTREYVQAARPPRATGADEDLADEAFVTIEVTGVVPEKEMAFRTHTLSEGRFLLPADENAIVVERLLAREFKLGLGDTILLRHNEPPQPVHEFKVVGIIDRRRASVSQAMMTWTKLSDAQRICKMPGKIKAVDIIVADPTVENIQHIASEIREVIDRRNAALEAEGRQAESVIVKTTEAQHKKLGAAKGLLQFIMMLLSCVVLLTAFFIVLATMSMGVTEQITELGLLRCVGVTRWQLGGLVLLQTVPFGLIGTALGVPLGLALHWLTVQVNPEYLGDIAVNRLGIMLAVLGGIGTTLLGVAIPSVSAFFVSPVEAARPHTGGRLVRWVWLFAVVGVGLIVAHEVVKQAMSGNALVNFDAQAVASLLLLYAGAALLAPAAVVVLGRLIVRATAAALRLRPQLLGDEIDKAPFRAASICCGLMVALSLIVGLIVWGRSVKQGWQFPKEFPDAMLYSYEPRPLDEIRALRNMDGIKEFTVTDDFPFSLRRPSKIAFLRSLQGLDQFSRFLAIEPDEGFALVKLAFLEGNERDARAKLKQGNHILVSREFAQEQDKHLGDRVTIWVGDTEATFTIAGVVASPGLDIAISFFNATTFFQTYAVRAIFGTLDDAKRIFGRSRGKLMLFNFDLPDDAASSRVTGDSSQAVVPETKITETGRPTFNAGSDPIPGDGPEERIVNRMLERLGYPPKAFVTARELKQKIDRNIDRVTLLLSAIPAVGLIIAALGVANLMAASVASRSRQTAVLRAIGVTKNQMSRIVIGEALVLGLLGSVMGLALGVYLGQASNFMTELLSGFRPEFKVPWPKVCLGAALATALCVLAALIPARYASRSNIVAALSD
ncbi:MAG: ABC transporter permease [Phycisphaerae bacterium]|nr:ABC transporter permease [Phycisphaerae bacterium]